MQDPSAGSLCDLSEEESYCSLFMLIIVMEKKKG